MLHFSLRKNVCIAMKFSVDLLMYVKKLSKETNSDSDGVYKTKSFVNFL